MGKGVGWWWSGEEGSSAAGEVDQGGRDEVEKGVDISRSYGAQVRRGRGWGWVRVKP
jgi:hypothetical protein